MGSRVGSVGSQTDSQIGEDEWVSFPGGELEGKRPKTLCAACREQLRRQAAGRGVTQRPRALCFQCYRAEMDRERALEAAGNLDTASVERFQTTLPFEPVDTVRLRMLRVEHARARAAMPDGTARFVDKRRRAQIAARHALQAAIQVIGSGVQVRTAGVAGILENERIVAAAIHAAELQLPESWLPFVMSR
jgi:hypothetical protein